MKRATFFILGGGLVAGGVFAAISTRGPAASIPTSTGKYLTPLDAGVDVGSYPCNLALSPDGRYIVATDSGSREQLSVLDAVDGHLVSKLSFNGKNPKKETLYFGLAFGPDGVLYASRGGEDKITSFKLTPDGRLEPIGDMSDASANPKQPNFLGGIALSSGRLYVAHNETYPGGKGSSAIAEIDLATGKVAKSFAVGGFPLSVESLAQNGREQIFASCERDGMVAAVDEQTGNVSQIRTGRNPSYLLKTPTHLWVSNSGSDTISCIDPQNDRVVKTVLVRPAEVRGLPSCTPLGLAESHGNLFAACADLNAVAVIDEKTFQLRGYLPVGWCPTALKTTADGKRLFVANAKGTNTRTPNPKPIAGKGTYILSVMEGTVSMIDLDKALAHLPALSRQVVQNNRFDGNRERSVRDSFKNPGIDHVIYIIKENRTYDNVLGDLKGGDGEPSICMFPRQVTPNEHALAERFVLLDNFSVCSEVSADGWNWSTSGMVNEYVSRNVPVNYSDRGRSYDSQAEVNGSTPDLDGDEDVARAPGGYIWDLCKKHGVSMRNYGFFVNLADADETHKGAQLQRPLTKALTGVTDPSYRDFDMKYPDSEAFLRYNFEAPGQMKTFGAHGSKDRFDEWKREFDGYVKNGNLPKFTMIQLPRDHTAGTAAGTSSPRAMVADNDYAVGQIVEAVSHSRYWPSTVICILEDDAQDGLDHVDCHRSPAFVISPFVRRASHDTRFYNTDSMLRTMELLLKMPPMCAYDAVANPIDDFGASADNAEPYDAILPSREIICEVNSKKAYRANDSAALIKRFREESLPDVELNDILWGDFVRHRDLANR